MKCICGNESKFLVTSLDLKFPGFLDGWYRAIEVIEKMKAGVKNA